MTQWHELGLREAAAAIRQGDVSAEAYAEALLARARACALLNAFTALDEDMVRQAARAADRDRAQGKTPGPLAGVPLAIKDNIDTVGQPTTAGTPALAQHRPAANAPVAQALFDAGAILFGKAGMHELALGVTSNNGAFGAVRNPYDPSRVPGGSSGGSGAAVGARIVPAAIGSDTGASIRLPANYCGVAGFRPTVGRWSQQGIVPISATRDTAGPIARSVADLLLLDEVVVPGEASAAASPLAGKRIGVSRRFYFEDIDPEVLALTDAALEAIAEAGAAIVPIDLAELGGVEGQFGLIIALYEMQPGIEAYVRAAGLDLSFADIVSRIASPDVKAILDGVVNGSGAVPKAAYDEAMTAKRPRLIETFRHVVADNHLDAIAHPTSPLLPPPIGDDEATELNGRAVPTFLTIARHMGPVTLAGFPSISLPIGLSREGLPAGITFDALAGTDRTLLAFGQAVERVLPPMPAPPDPV
jgi:mandelamide amidase